MAATLTASVMASAKNFPPDRSVEDKPDEDEQQTCGGQRRHRIEHGIFPLAAYCVGAPLNAK
jgi:hypothetical protein